MFASDVCKISGNTERALTHGERHMAAVST